MYKLQLAPHSDISENDLNEIIRIKSVSWPYSYEDQIKWMNENLKGSDIHVLLSLDNINVAYLNLITIELNINSKVVNGLGVGNVCAKIRGNGWGQELMMLTNSYLRKNKMPGLLFCRDRLFNFYCMCHWKKLEPSILKVDFDKHEIVSMYFNYHEPVRYIEYRGRLF